MKTVLCICFFGLTLFIGGCATTTSGAYTPISSSSDFYLPVDNPSPTLSDEDASDAVIQEENNINAMNASNAAAEQQNEAAQQQATQDEINAMPINNSNQ